MKLKKTFTKELNREKIKYIKKYWSLSFGSDVIKCRNKEKTLVYGIYDMSRVFVGCLRTVMSEQ